MLVEEVAVAAGRQCGSAQAAEQLDPVPPGQPAGTVLEQADDAFKVPADTRECHRRGGAGGPQRPQIRGERGPQSGASRWHPKRCVSPCGADFLRV